MSEYGTYQDPNQAPNQDPNQYSNEFVPFDRNYRGPPKRERYAPLEVLFCDDYVTKLRVRMLSTQRFYPVIEILGPFGRNSGSNRHNYFAIFKGRLLQNWHTPQLLGMSDVNATPEVLVLRGTPFTLQMPAPPRAPIFPDLSLATGQSG